MREIMVKKMGMYYNLYPRPGRIHRVWGIGVVDALNELYGWLTDGAHDINVNSIYAIYGNFASRPYAEGRPVILDGDPISIYQFYDVAKEQITEAIDKSKVTATLDQIYGNLLTIEQYTKDTRDVVVKLRIDEYGNIGVRIAEPVDEYGYVKTVVVDDKANIAKETTLQSIKSILDIYLSTRASESTLSNIKSKTDNIDVALSTRASETTLSGIKSQTDKLTFDDSNYLQVNVRATVNPSNLDVALSTRASEATLSAIKNALASVGTDKMRVSVVDALPESSFNISKVAGTALTGRDWSSDFAKLQNLDVSLTTQATLERWGRNVSPFWIYGSEVTAPAAGTALVSRTVTLGKTGYIYGFVITAGEANDFRLNWTSGGTTRSVRFTLSSKGSVVLISPVALNEGLPADGGSSITITNVNAGSSGIVYQATILYAEV
jgi:hypothetical protein